MVTTMKEAARLLGISNELLYTKVKSGKVSAQRAGRIVLVDPEVARRELEAAGFYRRSEMYKRKKAARIASPE